MDLPGFDRIVAVDTEFTPVAGGHIIPVCYVAHELISGERARLWYTELGPEPPFPTDERTLYVAHSAQAEIGFHLACLAVVAGAGAGVRHLRRVPQPHQRGAAEGVLQAEWRARTPVRPAWSPRWTISGSATSTGTPSPRKRKCRTSAIRGAPFTEQEKQRPSALLRGRRGGSRTASGTAVDAYPRQA